MKIENIKIILSMLVPHFEPMPSNYNPKRNSTSMDMILFGQFKRSQRREVAPTHHLDRKSLSSSVSLGQSIEERDRHKSMFFCSSSSQVTCRSF